MKTDRIEWPTIVLLLSCYLAWGLSTTLLATAFLPLAIIATAFCVALHSSLTHEVVHGHPIPGRPQLNAALVFPALPVVIPFRRFRDTHLAHHNDAVLTDPYDDPETNYMVPSVWVQLPLWVRAVLNANNTLAGRLIIGPMVSYAAFVRDDLRLIRAGEPGVLTAWGLHIFALLPVVWWLAKISTMPVWAYGLAVYVGHAILKIRTFLEHQAHERASGRSVIIEDRGPLAWMFLNNNLHVVHHMHPKVPWYRLPRLYRDNAAHYRRRNGGYVYRSYAEVFRLHFLRRKDPVPHPLHPG
ncbi:MAG: fatty acid desaturase [Pseudomonadota bacterium]